MAVPFASSTLGNVTFVKQQRNRPLPFPCPLLIPALRAGTLNILAGPRHFALDVGRWFRHRFERHGIHRSRRNSFGLPALASPPLREASPSTKSIISRSVTNTGCNQVSVFSLKPAKHFSIRPSRPSPPVELPTGVAVLPRLAYTGQAATQPRASAVVTNNSSNTVSVLDLVNAVPVKDASGNAITLNVGTAPAAWPSIRKQTRGHSPTPGRTLFPRSISHPLTATPIGTLAPISVALSTRAPSLSPLTPIAATNLTAV